MASNREKHLISIYYNSISYREISDITNGITMILWCLLRGPLQAGQHTTDREAEPYGVKVSVDKSDCVNYPTFLGSMCFRLINAGGLR